MTLLWHLTIVDALAFSRLSRGSLANPGTTATDVVSRNIGSIRD